MTLNLKRFIPIAKPLPIGTFPSRTKSKIMSMISILIARLGSKLNLLGAKEVSITAHGNVVLRINYGSAFFKKGVYVEAPRDGTVFKSIRAVGSYAIEESIFIKKALIRVSGECSEVLLVDIGANIGLVTMQAMYQSRTRNDVLLFEPIPQHVAALRSNLSQISGKVTINQFALSDKDGTTIMYTEMANRGNSSTLKSVIPDGDFTSTQVRLVNTTPVFSALEDAYSRFVIKSDTQGMDAMILSRIPESIWKKTTAAVIEVWALIEINESDVDVLLKKISHFEVLSWSSDLENTITIKEIKEFWLGRTGDWRNLYIQSYLG